MKAPLKSQGNAFTLVELLVVIAIVAVLSMLLLPALAHSKIKSPAAGCLSSLRQLQQGWAMYKDDFNDVMLPNNPLGAPINQSWYVGQTEDWNNADGNTNTLFLQTALLAPYVPSNMTVYRCPADVIPSTNGRRIRSYSMNSQMGAVYDSTTVKGYNPGYRTYIKGSDLTCPTPQSAFIFCDESMCSLQDGFFQVRCNTPSFPDVPGAYHEWACGFSFADGHAEIHKWATQVLNIPLRQGYRQSNVTTGVNNADWKWLISHSACQ